LARPNTANSVSYIGVSRLFFSFLLPHDDVCWPALLGVETASSVSGFRFIMKTPAPQH
jgi:hypothetical protein